MKANGKLVEALNSVVRINNDRQDGYQLAARQTDDPNLKKLFARFSSQSVSFRDELVIQVTKLSAPAAHESTLQGKVFRAWMEVKKAVTGGDKHAILASCEFGEDAALEAYDEALQSDVLTSEIRELLHRQRLSIREAHDQIKKLRDNSAQNR